MSIIQLKMTSKERMAAAMSHMTPDRVPVMCQLSLGHYFLNCKYHPSRIWFDSETFALAITELQKKYSFDGVLINLPGRPYDWEKYLASEEKQGSSEKLIWKNGYETIIPNDDNAHTFLPGRIPLPRAAFETQIRKIFQHLSIRVTSGALIICLISGDLTPMLI